MDKSEQLIETAHRLFEQQGFHATGVDQIASDAGVTKRTLYKHFGSKEGLIAVVLERHHKAMLARVRARVEASGPEAEARLMCCFDLYGEWFAHPDFAGCIYIKTLNEFRTCSSDLCKVARRSKQSVRDYLVEIACSGDLSGPEALADQLQLLLEGAVIVAQFGCGKRSIETAREIAQDLIKQAGSG